MALTSNDQYVLEILQERGLVTAEQIEEAQSTIIQAGTSTVDVDSDESATLAGPWALAGHARWSPDGTMLAFTGEYEGKEVQANDLEQLYLKHIRA